MRSVACLKPLHCCAGARHHHPGLAGGCRGLRGCSLHPGLHSVHSAASHHALQKVLFAIQFLHTRRTRTPRPRVNLSAVPPPRARTLQPSLPVPPYEVPPPPFLLSAALHFYRFFLWGGLLSLIGTILRALPRSRSSHYLRMTHRWWLDGLLFFLYLAVISITFGWVEPFPTRPFPPKRLTTSFPTPPFPTPPLPNPTPPTLPHPLSSPPLLLLPLPSPPYHTSARQPHHTTPSPHVIHPPILTSPHHTTPHLSSPLLSSPHITHHIHTVSYPIQLGLGPACSAPPRPIPSHFLPLPERATCLGSYLLH